jgi:3-hydroxybutyryl-CoA dehydrogenase
METVMKDGMGYPMGPLRLLDVVGLDVSLAIQRRLYQTFRDPGLKPARYLEHLVQLDHLGRKSGSGFDVYSDR